MTNEVTNLDLLLTRGRALGISFLYIENVPSRISKEARVSAHLIAAFNTAGPEIRATAELLGFTSKDEVEELRTALNKGQSAETVFGDNNAVPESVQNGFRHASEALVVVQNQNALTASPDRRFIGNVLTR